MLMNVEISLADQMKCAVTQSVATYALARKDIIEKANIAKVRKKSFRCCDIKSL